MAQTPTLHNAARKGEIAPFVLMPGDPKRAEYIAEKFLESARLVSDIRSIKAYTGKYNGKDVSVMASGMGTSSMSIYSYELFNFYDVETIIRVGSAGALQPSMELMDIVIASAADTDTSYMEMLDLPGKFAPTADFGLAAKAYSWGISRGMNVHAGTVFSGEAFYYDKEKMHKWAAVGALAAEMESAALYTNAAMFGKKALALLTISDFVFKEGSCTEETKVTGFSNMMEMALSLL